MKANAKPPVPIYQLAMKGAAILLLASMGLKAITDVDIYWDVWSYHMPFAGLLWGISTPETLLFDSDIQVRFDGFGLLGEFFQGFFWFITGRFETGNLVGFLSFVLYLFFLKTRFNIPVHLSAIALLAVPLIQMHAISSYVDLPANLAAAVAIMTTYHLYARPDDIKRSDLYLLFLGAACAANMRLMLIPIVFGILCFAIPRLVLLHFKNRKAGTGNKVKSYYKLSILCVALAIIFATPIKNTALHGNPVYPVKVGIGDFTLNHYASEQVWSPPKFPGLNASRPAFWLYSMFEIIPTPMYFYFWDINSWWGWVGTKFGGTFGAYILFQSIFFISLVALRRTRETRILIILFVIMTACTAAMPGSGQIRYYMYWIIVLISFNLYLAVHLARQGPLPKFLNMKSLSLTASAALLVVIIFTKAVNVSPTFYSLEDFKRDRVYPKRLSSVQSKNGGCITRAETPYFYLYSSALHPPLKYRLEYCYRF